MIVTVTLNASIDKAYEMNQTIQYGTVMRVGTSRNSAGGKGINVARIVKLCKEEVLATGLVGGYNGKYLEELLSQDGIPHDFGYFDGETRSCINVLDQTYGSTEFLEPGSIVKEKEERTFLDNFFKLIHDSTIVTLSGSVPNGVSMDIYKRMIQKVKEAGKQVILDTSGELLEQGLKACPTVVKPNKEEIELLFKTKIKNRIEMILYASKIYEQGIPYVLVSLGKEGAIMICKEGIFQGTPPDIEVKNTVGCGDSMVGAFAVALHRNYPHEQALKFAMSVAAANALSLKTGYFEPAMSQTLFHQIQVGQI